MNSILQDKSYTFAIQIVKLAQSLQKEQKENVLADEALMPAWIRTFTRQAYE